MQEKSSVTADIIVRKAMYNMVTYANIHLNTNVQELHVSSGRSKPQNNLILSGVGGWKGEFLSRIIWPEWVTIVDNCFMPLFFFFNVKPHGNLWCYGAKLMKWRWPTDQSILTYDAAHSFNFQFEATLHV